MPKDRDQLTPAEADDEATIESHRGPGTAGSGEDVLPGEHSAPGAAAGGGGPRAVDEVDAETKHNYR